MTARRMDAPSHDPDSIVAATRAQLHNRYSGFRSIVFDRPDAGSVLEGREALGVLIDLNLDQIIASITAGREEYNLQPLFCTPLLHVETVNYRHDIFRDLDNPALLGHIETFAQKMRSMREQLRQADKIRYIYQKQRWFLDAVDVYCDAVGRLTRDLTVADPRSRGLVSFREYLTSYTTSGEFLALLAATRQLKASLSAVRYCLYIEGPRIHVGRYEALVDYGADVLQTFEKFKQGTVQEYRFDLSSRPEMNQIEAAVLDRVVLLYPEVFASLDQYCSRHRDYLDATIRAFDREVHFYIACIDHIKRFRPIGLHFCYPTVSDRSKDIYGREVFDLALANKLSGEKKSVVSNDFYLQDPERIMVVSGANQGGKTTFARIFGQLHYLASLGCPVPGSEAKLFLFDRLFTHFDKEEDLKNLSGKLEEELLRIHAILERATPNSILVMNESLGSTTLSDALVLGDQIMRQIMQRGMLCVYVTFLDELASLSDITVSMVATVDPKDPSLRTFKVIRQPADGLAYALAIAKKYRLTYQSLKERLGT